jgi:hypothetical protein
MLKPIRSKIVAALVGLVAVAGSAAAVNTFYRSYNAATNQNGYQGLMVFGGTPILTTGSVCGPLTAAVGGTSKGVLVASTGGAAIPSIPAVNLGAASTFGVLAYSGITNTGNTTVVGDIGSSPTNSITGFPPGTFTGTNHGSDATSAAAQVALAAAITDAAGRTPTTAVSADIGGQVFTAGYYKAASSLAITGTVTLNGQGNPNAIFIFQSPSSTLTTASNAVVLLTNGAQAGNVFWVVGSSATLGIGTTFVGTILASASITVNGGGTDNGRLLANTGAVTFATAETANFDGSGGGSSGGNACALTLTLPTPTIVVSSGLNDGKNAVNSAAVPTRLACSVKDLTTPSDMFLYSATPTATSCSLTGTITAGDLLEYRVEGY